MSMRPRALPEVPEQTAAVAKAAFRKGTLAMRVRDELGEVFADGASSTRSGSGASRDFARAAGDGHGAAVRREPHRSASRRRGAGTYRLEILFRSGADGSGLRFHRAVAVSD